jgi:hypothetical protein
MPISTTFKYIIIAFIIITIVLIILMMVKPNMFFETSSSNGKITDLKRTSKNGDMTINPSYNNSDDNSYENSDDENSYENSYENSDENSDDGNYDAPPIRLNATIRTRTAIHRPTIHRPTIHRPEIHRPEIHRPEIHRPEIHRPHNIIIGQIRAPDQFRNTDQVIPDAQDGAQAPNMDNIFDMVFNDLAITLQTMNNNNEFNILQHMNDHNIYHINLNNNNLGLMDILDNHILDIIGGHRNNIITTNQTTAQQNANTRGDAIDNYIELATRPTNDSQNVHDHTVLSGFKLILERLIEDRNNNEYAQNLLSLDEIKNEIKQKERQYSDNRPQIAIKALGVIDKMKDGEQISALEIDGNPTTDQLCLQVVWDRANHQLNSKNEQLIKQSIFDNLVDAWEFDLFTNEQKIVCVTGRATRMLSSLTLLDFDEQNWEVKKFEEFKNEIFNKVKHIIMEQAKIATLSPDQNMKNAGLTYLAKTSEELNAISTPSNDAIINLNNIIKKEISNMISSYVQSLEIDYNTKIPEYMKNSIEKEAIASIDMF